MPVDETLQAPPRSYVLLDHAAHAFTFEIATWLASSGNEVLYAYTKSLVGPKGSLQPSERLVLRAVGGTRPFDRYRQIKRAATELRLGFGYLWACARNRRSQVIAANMPLLTLSVVWFGCRVLRQPRVLWLQDLQAELALRVGGTSRSVYRILKFVERTLIRWSTAVVTISEEMAEEVGRISQGRCDARILRNWAPIERLPLRPRSNEWSKANGLEDLQVIIYSGTLARKHAAGHLRELATALDPTHQVLVVISEGEGADWLREQQLIERDLPVRVLPFQPFEALPDVLASGDLLIVLLSAEAGCFSVPSKTLSYLCAGRAIVASVPSDNLAARIIRDEAAAGVVVDPSDTAGFTAAARSLLSADHQRDALGRDGRRYAEREFARETVIKRFVDSVTT